MGIRELKLGEIDKLVGIFAGTENPQTLNDMLGQMVIIRTFSAGVWFGELEQKARDEVVLKDARRMWGWWAAKSISLSAVALYGIKHDESRIAPAIPRVWLQAIEIIPCSDGAIKSLEEAPDAEAR